MREHQIGAAAVNVKPFAQQAQAHSHALNVPAGAPGHPRRIPRRLARLGCLPQREILRAALALVHLHPHPRAFQQDFRVLPHELAVAGELGDLKIHPGIVNHIAHIALHKL